MRPVLSYCKVPKCYDQDCSCRRVLHKKEFDSFSKSECVCVCVFVYEVVYETKSKFPCCLVGTSQFDGQNFYGPLAKNSVKTWNYHNRYFNCDAAQYSKTEYLVFAPVVHLVRVKKIYIYWDIWHTNTRSKKGVFRYGFMHPLLVFQTFRVSVFWALCFLQLCLCYLNNKIRLT